MRLLKSLRHIPRLWHTETSQYADRVNANGGSITEASLDAIDRFVAACKAAAIWNKFIEVGPFAGSNLNAALVKLVYPLGGSSALTNSNFVSADYIETGASGGLAGDGTKFLNTELQATALPDNGHFSFYLREDVSASGNRAMLGALSGSDQFWLGSLAPASSVDCRFGGVITASAAESLSKGFYTSARESSTSLSLYRNGVSIAGTAGAASATKPAQPIYLWAFNSGGTASAKLPARGSFYSIGQALVASEVVALHNAVRNLQIALNRAIN